MAFVKFIEKVLGYLRIAKKHNFFEWLILIVLVLVVAAASFFLPKSISPPRDFLVLNTVELNQKELNLEKPNHEKEKEVIDGLVIIRNLDKELIRQKIEEGKEYLLRMIDEKENGVHKYYYALNDTFENRLHTIYTSTLTYTLLKLYNLEKDDSLLNQALKCGEFILSMQNKEKESRAYGAFYYSYYLDSKEKEKKFMVGTTSKTIFTLLKLYELTGNSKYLEAAKLGADWLTTMQRPDGSMKPYMRYDIEDEKWLYGTKESLLYNGQVLSALSKIYIVTKEKKYYDIALKIAQCFTQKVEKEGCYLGDDYRIKNPISSSWLIMALLDFYRTNQNEYYGNIIFSCSEKLLEKRIKNDTDIINYGRWKGTSYTSGNGWLVEVMTEVYQL